MNKELKIDINSASKEDLASVKGIGLALAEKIIENRPYSDLNELTKVPGIGSNSLESIKSKLTITSQDTSSDFQAFVDSLQDESRSQAVNLDQETDEEKHKFHEATNVEFVEESQKTWDDSISENEDSEVFISESEILEADVRVLEEEIETPSEPNLEKEIELNKETLKEQIIDVNEIPKDERFVEEEKTFKETTSKVNDQIENKGVEKEVELEKTESSENWITRSQLVWSMVGTAVFSIILTALITLGILSATNGGLRYATINDAKLLENQITLLNDSTTTMKTDIEGIKTRLDTLETVAGRVTSLESRADEVDGELDIIQTSIKEISETLVTVQDEIEALKIAAEKSANFRTGLMQLLMEIDGVNEEGK